MRHRMWTSACRAGWHMGDALHPARRKAAYRIPNDQWAYSTSWPVMSLPATRPCVIAMPMELPANGVA